jgi:transposase
VYCTIPWSQRRSDSGRAQSSAPLAKESHLFVFRSRRGDRLKILVWERDGFLLWYKRLEAGVFKLPKVGEGSRSVELRASELAMILDGIDVSKLKRVPRYERSARSGNENGR